MLSVKMPASSDVEGDQLLDPALDDAKVAADDDEEALRSQLMANIEQTKLVDAASAESERPFNHDSPAAAEPDSSDAEKTPNGHYEEDGAQQPAVAPTQTVHTASDEDLDMTDNESLPSESAALRNAEAAQQEHSHSAQGSPDAEEHAEDGEQDDETYEDATSNVDTTEVEPAADTSMTSKAESDFENEPDTGESASGESGSDSDGEEDACLFCDRKERKDTDAGEVLACTICRRPAHRACAEAKEGLENGRDAWRCPTCVHNQTSESPKETASKPRHSAPRLVRDLLPVSRGVQKPGAHSIFAQPLIQDDDGGRALRKRKSPSAERPPGLEHRRKKMKETPRPDKVEPESLPHGTRRSSQKLAPGVPPVPIARILQHRPFHKPPPHKLILAFRLDQGKIEAILSEPPKPSRRRYMRKKQKIPAPPVYHPPVPKFPALPTHHLIFPSMFGERESEINAKPFGGILSEAEADTSRSLPQMRDREIFETARKEAEEERKKSSEKAEAQINGLNGEGANVTSSKRTVSGPPSKIKCIQFGRHIIDTSYAAPYPEEYSHESRLFICEFCLKYLPSEFVAWRHKLKCPHKHPPGDEIYRDGSLSVWEVDGRKKTEYCQCLCLMAKLFLGSKTLYYDVDPFLFYVLTEYDDYGYHFVGYFSKEKRPASQNNVSCILVMPIHQRKGYATFLIEFSYLLTRIEGKEGSPEKPLSDMGLTAYRSYWDLTISKHLLDLGDKPFSIKDIMLRTGMTADDVVHSLERLYAFVKDPVTKTYAIRYNKTLYEGIVEKYESKGFRKIRSERLVWTPYIMGRSDAATLDAQPITAVAQREEDEIQVKDQGEDTSDHVSPRTSQKPSQQSPSPAMIDPALRKENGHVAPGPPSTDAMDGVQPAALEAQPDTPVLNGDSDKGKTAAEEPLAGYALAYETEKIPATRFQIDPPIPPAMIRYARSKRKSMTGTPRPNGSIRQKPSSPQATRSSPRKAGSVNGSTTGMASSRATTPEKAGASIRRSGRKSGLANEIVTDDATGQEEDEEYEEDIAVVDDDEEDGDGEQTNDSEAVLAADDEVADEGSDVESAIDDETSDQSDTPAEDDDDEESDASDDPDAVVEEEDDDDDASEEEEEEDDDDDDDDDAEIDIPSAVSSPSASVNDADESTEDE